MNKLFLILLIVSVSCNSSKESVSNPAQKTMKNQSKTNSDSKDYPFEVLINSSVGGYKQPVIHVMKEAESVKEIYDQINIGRSPKIDVPNLDFKKDMLVGIFRGEFNTGGYSVTVNKIEEKAESIVVHVQEKGPKPMDNVIMALTQPYCIIKLPYTSKALIFEKEN